MQAKEDEETLARWRADAEGRTGRPVRSRVLSGDPAAEIVRHAREERCDLVVVGTHGRTGIQRLVLGSVAERVARQSPCPVLVVHDHGVLEKEGIADELAQYR
jgi:nucleotide-binding universal stress UspA family protein